MQLLYKQIFDLLKIAGDEKEPGHKDNGSWSSLDTKRLLLTVQTMRRDCRRKPFSRSLQHHSPTLV